MYIRQIVICVQNMEPYTFSVDCLHQLRRYFTVTNFSTKYITVSILFTQTTLTLSLCFLRIYNVAFFGVGGLFQERFFRRFSALTCSQLFQSIFSSVYIIVFLLFLLHIFVIHWFSCLFAGLQLLSSLCEQFVFHVSYTRRVLWLQCRIIPSYSLVHFILFKL